MYHGYTADLRALATAIDARDIAEHVTIGDAPNQSARKVEISWLWGAAMPGYRELSRAMSLVATRRWGELRDEAMALLESDVKNARDRIAERENAGVEA